MIEVDKRVIGPELRSKLFPGHQFPWVFQQENQDLERLLTHLHSRPELPQFAGAQIECKRAEHSASCSRRFHRREPSRGRGVNETGRIVRFQGPASQDDLAAGSELSS